MLHEKSDIQKLLIVSSDLISFQNIVLVGMGVFSKKLKNNILFFKVRIY